MQTIKMLIGLIGLKESGKSTIAKIISELDPETKKLSFSDPLKQCCKIVFNLNDEQLYGNKKEEMTEWGVSARIIMQFTGTELFREKLQDIIPSANDIWIKNMESRIKDLDKVVIDDVRFENEAALIKKKGGTLIKIVRGNIKNKDQHKSETEMEKIKVDYVIENNGTIEDLEKKVLGILYSQEFIKRKNVASIYLNSCFLNCEK